MVNGKVWPNMNVDQGQYRLRILDGSNARFYTLSFWVPSLGVRLPFTVIGTDGGYLGTAATVNQLTVAPGERYDVLVDFSGLPPGTKVIMDNKAKAPFPNGAIVDPKTTGRIMQFTVGANPGFVANALPAVLNPTIGNTYPSLAPAPVGNQRILTLQEVMGPLGPTMILLNGQTWMDPTTEIPTEGETEEWVIVNPTADTHPIHLHLVQFQLVSRQAIDIKKYDAAWIAANGMAPVMGTVTPIPIGPYLKGAAAPPNPWESGWKDTIQMNPGEVTIIRIRFSPLDGSSPYFNFDPSQGPGYVWHCHIIDHEDNEMMRRYTVIASPNRPIP
jgi:FtsP/CotA-like multicopper oxidase with cupredoxin domain